MHWQNWSYKKIYVGIIFPIYAILSLRYWMTPFDLIHVNQGFSEWGLPFSSKYHFLEPFKKTEQFLAHTVVVPNEKDGLEKVKKFMQEHKMKFPIIGKPEQGVVGIGVAKIDNEKELKTFIEKIPKSFIFQEYANLPYEFGIYYRRFPWEKKGKVISLTRKDIPHVVGDGKSTVKELIEHSSEFTWNKNALLTHAHTLEEIPKKGKKFQIIIQASHTYGTVFRDYNEHITPQLEAWIDTLSKSNKTFYYGRYDMKLPSLEALQTGKGAKIIELNGTTAEPIHMYDDNHSLGFGIRTLFSSYKNAFRIAKHNKKALRTKTPIQTIIRKYKAYLKQVKEVKKIVG